MLCTHCRYPLWNLTARACPECGRSFSAHDYRFDSTVRWRCPACEAPSPIPINDADTSPACSACNAVFRLDDVALVPPDARHIAPLLNDNSPWHANVRDRWGDSIALALESPARLICTTHDTAPLATALWFHLRNVLMFCLLCQVTLWFVLLAAGSLARMAMYLFASLLAALLGAFAAPLLVAALAHAIMQPRTHRLRPLRITIYAAAYSSAALAVAVAPIVGIPAAAIYYLYILKRTLAAGHGVSECTAGAAVFTAAAIVFAAAALILATIFRAAA